MGTAEFQGKHWGKASKHWATIQEPLHGPLWEAMLDAALVGSGTRMLDAGCGGGGASLLAAQRGAEVSGIDAAEELVAFARERLPNRDFRVGDIEYLPFEDDAFDAVFAANSLQFSGDRIATLREFGRVCAQGGRIVVGLFGPPEKVTFSVVFKALSESLPTPPSGAGPFELSMPGMLEGLFEAAGLKVLGRGEVDVPNHYADFEEMWLGVSASGPFQAALLIIGQEKLKTALHKAVDPFRRDDGSILIQPNIFIYVVGTL